MVFRHQKNKAEPLFSMLCQQKNSAEPLLSVWLESQASQMQLAGCTLTIESTIVFFVSSLILSMPGPSSISMMVVGVSGLSLPLGRYCKQACKNCCSTFLIWAMSPLFVICAKYCKRCLNQLITPDADTDITFRRGLAFVRRRLSCSSAMK